MDKLSIRGLLLAATCGVAVLAAVLAFVIRGSERASQDRLEVLAENNLLLMQQLERIEEVFVEPLSQREELTPSEIATLEQWLLFDAKFVENNLERTELSTEVAYTARRAGHVASLLKSFDRSRELIQISLDMFGRLEQENPAYFMYRIEQAICRMQFVNLYMATGDRTQASRECRQVVGLLNADGATSNEERDESLSGLLPQVFQVCTKLGLNDLARQVADANSQVVERLAKIRGTDEQLKANADQMLRAAKATTPADQPSMRASLNYRFLLN